MKMFIEQSDNRKIEILDYLIRASSAVTFSELIEVMPFSEKTIRSILLSYQENPYLNKNRLEINYTKAGTLHSVQLKDTSLTNASFFYLERAPLFLMIKELFLEGELNREKICAKYFISQATFSRNKGKLKKILQIFEFELTTNNRIVGEEYRIRNFFYMFFSYATSEWLFSENAYVSLEKSITSGFVIDFDPAKKSLMILLLYICKVRNIQGYSLDTSTTIKFEENSNYKHIYKDITNYVEKNFSYIEKKVEEIQFIFFFCIRVKLIVPDIYQEENLLVDTNQIEKLEESNNSLTELILEHFLEGNEKLRSLVQQKIFHFLLFVHFNFIDMRNFLYVYDKETYFSKSNFENKINEKVTFLFYETKKNYPENPFIKKIVKGNVEDAVINQLYLMIYSILLQNEKRQPLRVKVYVHNSKVYIADILKGIIKKIFLENVEIANVYDSTVDIFITDKLYSGEIDHPVRVYVQTFSDRYFINRMCTVIEEEILKKIDNSFF